MLEGELANTNFSL